MGAFRGAAGQYGLVHTASGSGRVTTALEVSEIPTHRLPADSDGIGDVPRTPIERPQAGDQRTAPLRRSRARRDWDGRQRVNLRTGHARQLDPLSTPHAGKLVGVLKQRAIT